MSVMARRGRLGRMRRWLLVALVLAVAGPAAWLSIRPADATTTVPGPVYGIGGKCLDVDGGNTVEGTKVQLWTCNGTGAQQWSMPGDGTVRALGKCLDVYYGNVTNGTPVTLVTCNGTGAQQWTATASNQLINPHSNACLDAKDISSADGTPMQIWACTGAANQIWRWTQSANVWLTTTQGDQVVRGLQQQPAVAFASTSAAADQVINVADGNTYQRFTGGGASMTDSAGYLLMSSGLVWPASVRDEVMTKLFDPVKGIGLSFLRNPIGSSDLAVSSYSFDDMPAGKTDVPLANFSIEHDFAGVLPLTKQARAINPALTVAASPWSAPAWMKTSNSFNLGSLKREYYLTYAKYFVKYLQAYRDHGVPIDFVTVQNEPGCCDGYPSMEWTPANMQLFLVTYLFPSLHEAGLTTKVLVLDWNRSQWASDGAPLVLNPAVRNDPNFGGIAWHGYDEMPEVQSAVHAQYPTVDQYVTEHTGGFWNNSQSQQAVDFADIVSYTRNWGKTITKWSLALDQNHGPFNKRPGADNGCTACRGLITVDTNGRDTRIEYTVEYYDMGHLTKFVKPGAYRIDSTASSEILNVAWKNPDGSKALIAYNTTGRDRSVKVNWGAESFTYTLPANTSATFTW